MARLMKCHEAIRNLWVYLDGELSESEQEKVDEHLEHCLRCCGEVAFAKEIRGVLATRSRPALPGEVQQRLEGFIDSLGEPTVNS